MQIRNLLRNLALLTIAISIAGSAFATTYYVDFSSGSDSNNGTSKTTPWKHVKGMAGCSSLCSSATLAGGDTVIFKGGVTWTNSFLWTIVGGSSSMITYTTDHTWFNGSSFKQPIFDDGHAEPGPIGMIYSSGAFITINDLAFTNCGTSGVPSSTKCLIFENTHDISITNSTFTTQSWINVYFVFSAAGSRKNFTFSGNDVSHTTGAVWFASAAAGATESNLIITGNTYHDYSDMLGGGAHGDGALHYFNSPANDNSQYLDGLTFANNSFYGNFTRGISGGTAEDMTGMIYFEGGLKNGAIFNNLFTFSPVQNTDGLGTNIFEAIIDLRAEGSANATNLKIYNNSIYGDTTKQSMSAAILINGYTNGDLRNNIVTSGSYCGYGEGGVPAGWTNDYNEWSCPNGFMTFMSPGSHSIPVNAPYNSNPLWMAAPSDLRLTANSPDIGSAVNLSGLGMPMLNTDPMGVARPQSGAWDIGALVHGSSSGTLSPPTNLTATVQ
jgi:hypothetical protein